MANGSSSREKSLRRKIRGVNPRSLADQGAVFGRF
jgi:hypothetical protein